jgi:hypothetical protein
MNWLRLLVRLAVFVPGFAMLGVFAEWDNYFSVWGRALIGTPVGVFFGLALGGVLPRGVAACVIGPAESAEK